MNNENNDIKNKIDIKYIIPLISLLAFIILNAYIAISTYTKINNSSDILRLHVVANSNNISDQITKLKVNENIQNYISNLNLNNLSNEDILNTLKDNSNEILNIANNTLKTNNANYTASMQIGKIMYDEKESQLIHMDEGVFESAKIILGNGEGKNIWSFICPNEENVSKLKSYETIMPGISKIYNDDTNNITYKSKILEIINILNNNNKEN